MSVGYFYKKNEEIYSDRRELNLDYLYENDIKYGPTLIDTLTFSFKNFNDSEILSILQPYGFNFSAIMDNGEFISKGGYERMYICQNTHSTFKCSWIRGCHSEISVLSLTGSACGMLYSNGVMFQFLLDLHNKIKAFGLFSDLYRGDKSFKCTRIDLCKDNFTPFFENLCKDNYGDLSCMFYSQAMDITPNVTFNNGKIKNGWTLYFGKRCNATFIRIYDKRTEQKINDERLPYWTRLEFEFKNKNNQLSANDIYFDLVNGESIDDVFIKHCEKKFFFLTKPWKSEKQCRRDEVAMHPEFKKFINSRWDNQQENLCFAKSLFFWDKNKNDETVKRLVSALVPKVLSNLTFKQIVYRLQDLIYSEGRQFRIDNVKKTIYVYYRSNTNDIMNDIPCLELSVPDVYWDFISSVCLDGEISLEQVLEIVEKCNNDYYSPDFFNNAIPDSSSDNSSNSSFNDFSKL